MTYYNPSRHMGYRAVRGRALPTPASTARSCPTSRSTSSTAGPTPPTRAGVETVLLAAPTTPDDRLVAICERSRGFVYGVVADGRHRRAHRARRARPARWAGGCKAVTDKPVLLGVGISNAEQAVEAAQLADGVIVGSALVAAPARRRRPRRRARVRQRAARRARRRLSPRLTGRDQVPRVEAPAGPGAHPAVRGAPTRAPRSTSSPARHASRRRSSAPARASPRSTPRATPRCSRARTSRPTRGAVDLVELAAVIDDLERACPGAPGLLHRDVLRAVALLPAVQRRARRRHPRRDRARPRRHAVPPDPAHQPASRRPTGSTPPPACRWRT